MPFSESALTVVASFGEFDCNFMQSHLNRTPQAALSRRLAFALCLYLPNLFASAALVREFRSILRGERLSRCEDVAPT